MESNILEMKNIRKRFGGITALENVSLSVKQGEIVAIAGENGAGKSTLMKILAGFYRPDSGDILFEGKKVLLKSARDSQRIGIETLYQDGALVDDLEICRNIFIGRELTMAVSNTRRIPASGRSISRKTRVLFFRFRPPLNLRVSHMRKLAARLRTIRHR